MFQNQEKRQRQSLYACPYCLMSNLTAEDLWSHFSAYHINVPSMNMASIVCPICEKSHFRKGLQKHIHFDHIPPNYMKMLPKSINTMLHSFSLVVCKDPANNRYLLCQEREGEGFWIPGGHVDPGEQLTNGVCLPIYVFMYHLLFCMLVDCYDTYLF